MLKILSRLDTHPSEQRELHEAFTAINQELLEHPNEAKWSLPQWSRWLDENGFSSQLINQGIHQLFESAGEAAALQSIEQALKAKESSTLAEALEISSQSHNQLVDELIEELAQHSQEIEDISATAGGTFKHPGLARDGFITLAAAVGLTGLYKLGTVAHARLTNPVDPNDNAPQHNGAGNDWPMDDPGAANEGRTNRAYGGNGRGELGLDHPEQDLEVAFRESNLTPETVDRELLRHPSAESNFVDNHGSNDSIFDNPDPERVSKGSMLDELKGKDPDELEVVDGNDDIDLDELDNWAGSGLKNGFVDNGIRSDIESNLDSDLDGLASKTETEIMNAEESAEAKLDNAESDAEDLVDI